MTTNQRLRALLLAGYAAVITILLAAGWSMTRSAQEAMREAIEDDSVALAAALMDEIQLAIGERVQALEVTAALNNELRAAVKASNAEFRALGGDDAARAYVGSQDAEWSEAAQEGVKTPFMMQISASSASRELRRVMDFHTRGDNEPAFGEIFVTNRYGANVGQTGVTTDFDQLGEPWWDAAWRDGVWVADEIVKDKSSGVHSLEIAIRVDDDETGGDDEANPLGVLKAVLDVTVVRELIDDFGRRSRLSGAVVELVSSRGVLIHRLGDPDAMGNDLSGERAVAALLRQPEGKVVETTSRGELLRAYVRATDTRPRGVPEWGLILNRPPETAYARVDKMTGRIGMVALVGALLALAVGWLMAIAFDRLARSLTAATDALRESGAQLRSIVTSAVDGVVTADAEGTILTFNPAAEQIFGRRAADVLGENVRVLMPERYAVRHDAYMQRYLRTGDPHIIGKKVEVQGLHADGHEFPLELALGEVEHGGAHRFVAIARDVSESHESRQALEEARDAAEDASRSKSQFLANMSHELRTPLNAIIGYSEMVAEELAERGNEELVEDLGRVQTAGRSLLGLIDEILDLAKVESGRLDVFAEPFDLNTVLRDIVATVQPLVARKGNALRVDAPAGLGTACTDVTKLRQILLNLLSNAAKFTESGTIELVARREGDQARDTMVFRVCDDGIGMTPQQLETVWEAFAQADPSTTRRYGGTGLGLTISRRFAELLGGTIEVESREGAGTTFTVRLPVLPVPPDASPAAAHDAEPAWHVRERSRAGTALVVVVDDDEDARDIVRRHLTAEGFEVVEAADGDEGLRLVRERRPDVIVLDVLMPGRDGWTVLTALREDPEIADTPVVMLTMAEQRDLGFALGVDAYLTKPVSREALARALAPYRRDHAPRRILVVEDDEPTRRLIGRVVGGNGCEIVDASNGAEALAALREGGADLIILDLMMPVMDGFQLVGEIQKDARLRDLPIIVVTAKDLTAKESERLEGAVLEVLRKGRYTKDELLSEVSRLVRRATQRGDAPDG